MPTHERPIRAMTVAMRCISAFAAASSLPSSAASTRAAEHGRPHPRLPRPYHR